MESLELNFHKTSRNQNMFICKISDSFLSVVRSNEFKKRKNCTNWKSQFQLVQFFITYDL